MHWSTKSFAGTIPLLAVSLDVDHNFTYFVSEMKMEICSEITLLDFIIITTIYFENVHFFHAKLGLDVCPISSPFTRP